MPVNIDLAEDHNLHTLDQLRSFFFDCHAGEEIGYPILYRHLWILVLGDLVAWHRHSHGNGETKCTNWQESDHFGVVYVDLEIK